MHLDAGFPALDFMVWRQFPSSIEGRGLPDHMSPTIGDDEKLREVLLAAKRAHDFGRGNADAQLAQVVPLIEALDTARRQRKGLRNMVHQLLAAIREIPIMPTDPMMGSEPLAYRWVVAKPAAFDKVIEKLRAEFPEVIEQ